MVVVVNNKNPKPFIIAIHVKIDASHAHQDIDMHEHAALSPIARDMRIVCEIKEEEYTI